LWLLKQIKPQHKLADDINVEEVPMIARQSIQTAIRPLDDNKIFVKRHLKEYPKFDDEKRAIYSEIL